MRRLTTLLGVALCFMLSGPPAMGVDRRPNVLVIWGDDIGTWNISHNSHGMMGYRTPNIDRIAREPTGRVKGHDDVPINPVVIQSAKRVDPAA